MYKLEKVTMSNLVRIKEEPDIEDVPSKDGWIKEYCHEDVDVMEMMKEARCNETDGMRIKEEVGSQSDDDLEDDGLPDVKIKVEVQSETKSVIDDGDSLIDTNGRSEIHPRSESTRLHCKPAPTSVSVIDNILSLLETFGESLVRSPLTDSSRRVFSFPEKDKLGEMSQTGEKRVDGEILKTLDSKSVNEIKESCLAEKSSSRKEGPPARVDKPSQLGSSNSADMNIHCIIKKEVRASEQGDGHLTNNCKTKTNIPVDKSSQVKSSNSPDVNIHCIIKKEVGASEHADNHVTNKYLTKTKKCKICDKEVNFGTLNKHQRRCRDRKTAGRIKTLKVKITKQINVTKEISRNLKSNEKKSFRSRKKQKREPLHKCKDCGKVFRKLRSLTIHVRTHTGEKPFKCKYCGKRFGRPEILERHERLHTKERPFKCGYCDRRFNGKQDVQKHERTHTGERPYKCKHCGKAFKDLGTLRPHEKIHTGEKPFKCKYCDMAFIRGCYLRRHERTHTGEKPFTCKQCGRAFSRMYTLRCHEKKIHNM